MKNIFIKFPTPILNYIFYKISSKNAMIFIGFVCTTILYSCISIKFGSKKHENFNVFEQKTWLKIGVGNLMKIFFIRNVPNNSPWSLKMSPVMHATIFPRKTMKNSRFFMYADYCRASYSKCMRCSSFAPTQWDHFFGGARAVELLCGREF